MFRDSSSAARRAALSSSSRSCTSAIVTYTPRGISRTCPAWSRGMGHTIGLTAIRGGSQDLIRQLVEVFGCPCFETVSCRRPTPSGGGGQPVEAVFQIFPTGDAELL